MGIFDIVCTANTRLKFPQLYSQTLDTFNVRIFWIWVLNAIIHSFLLFWICMFVTKHEVLWSNGREGGYLLMGNFIYTVKYNTIFLLCNKVWFNICVLVCCHHCVSQSWLTYTVMVLYCTYSYMGFNSCMVCVFGNL